jgi:putative FmdB family regulatory protein
MLYPYACVKCDLRYDVVKPVADVDRPEACPECGAPSERQFTARVHFTGTKVQDAEYNPGLGCVVRNKREREELAKRKNLVEVGNDFKSADRMVDHFDKAREQKLEERHKKALDEVV